MSTTTPAAGPGDAAYGSTTHTAGEPAGGPVQATSATFVGMPSFPDAARTALANTQQRRNLRGATHTIRAKRAHVVAEVPEWEALRVAGAEAKDEALTHLGDYLEQLETTLTAAGAVVHWARDAAEANRIVVDIVRAKEVDEVVKVKSMATQEIELNEALAAAGIDAWETDLAELIVQLGHDRPSHILVPAIHRNRSEIRDIFTREMGKVGRPAPADLTDDPARLAEAARLHLREKFLRAKVAVSGANFAVADTGTLVVVESEGNGRMCLTLPETLISVVGIEKVLPTWEDLGPMLQLLPRSSTGERMNPYTTMWSGVHDGDGPQEVHVILLDNGRTHVLADRVGRQALRCIRCSACLNVCPVYERTGGHAYGSVYPGPIGAVLNPQLRGTSSEIDQSLPYASSLCGACFDACPVRIDIPRLLVELRGTVAHQGGHRAESAAMKAAAWVLSDPRRLAGAQRAATTAGRIIGRRTIRTVPGLGAWTSARDLPTPPTETFRQWWARERGAGHGSDPGRDDGTHRAGPGTDDGTDDGTEHGTEGGRR
jgi:L-lactate dehydrogenase complex protein LldF